MMPDDTPLPETRGSLLPPTRHPPTALAVSTPPPPRRPRSLAVRPPAAPPTRRFAAEAVEFVFDRADAIGDGIAKLFGLRPGPAAPPAPPTAPFTRSDAVD